MRHEIILAPEAVEDFQALTANHRSQALDAMERYLRFDPAKCSKSRIKRLRGLSKPQFRLRVGSDIRVFYDVTELAVQILAIVNKADANRWLEQHGEK